MSFEALLQELNEKHKKDVEALIKEYDQKKEQVLKQGNEEFNRIINQAKIQSKFAYEREYIKRVGAAKLKAKRIIFEAIQEMLRNNMNNLFEALKDYVSTKNYLEILNLMINYAREKLGEDIYIKCRDEDKKQIEKLVKGKIKVEGGLNCIGGFIAYKLDNSAYVDLTLEEIIRLNEEKIKSQIIEKS
jgi:vacuolar-type H+-ATPase subunit E/Vma4